MGGSGAPGDVLKDWLGNTLNAGITVVKGRTLPRWTGEYSLVLAVSYSGNTAETIALAEQAYGRRCPIVVISSGGVLTDWATRQGVSILSLPKVLAPRVALPYMLYLTVRVLTSLRVTEDRQDELRAAVTHLEKVSKRISVRNISESNISIGFAELLLNRLPVIYSSEQNFGVANRFKSSLNENAKVQALCELLPELCHNSIVPWGFAQPAPLQPLLLRQRWESEDAKLEFKAILKMMRDAGYEPREIYGEGPSRLDELLTQLYITEYVTYYLAMLRGINPLATPSIDYLKEQKKLKRVG
jgi:glucose/mannose-6-phosphate isomerase